MWLFLIFLAVPIIEIALFIQVGGWIGLWPTLAGVVLTAVIGSIIVRMQGLRALDELRQSMADLRDPSAPLAHGALILLAGALLLTPGFFTDSVGFLLLVPPARAVVLRFLASRVRVAAFRYGETRGAGRPPPENGVIDGDFEELSPDRQPTHRPSGWTRH